MDDRLGFIGVGNLGAALAGRLLESGFKLAICDSDPSALEPLRAKGARVAATPREVADASPVVFACLPSREASREVALGADGAGAGKTIEVYVEMSTLGVPTIETIADVLGRRGVAVLDTPVTGGGGGSHGVQAGTLATMSAGPRQAFERVRPILSALTKNVFYVGDKPGMAQVCKMVNNAISIAGLTMACEAMVMGVKAGIDAKLLLDIVNAGSGRNSATADKFPRSILPRRFTKGGRLEIGLKDMQLYVETVHALGLPAPVGANILEVWRSAGSQGGDQRGYNSIIEYFERWAGVEVKG